MEQTGLQSRVASLEDLDGVPDLDESAKLRAVVFNEELPVPDLDKRVHSGDTDVSDLHVGVDAPANFEFRALVQKEDVNDLGGCALDRLHDEVVLLWSLEVHDLEEAALHLGLEGRLAELALKRLPEEALHTLAIVHQLLAVEPLLQTPNVDVTHGACALARTNELVLLVVFLFAQAYPAHFLVAALRLVIVDVTVFILPRQSWALLINSRMVRRVV